jgi:hypothetical protein
LVISAWFLYPSQRCTAFALAFAYAIAFAIVGVNADVNADVIAISVVATAD